MTPYIIKDLLLSLLPLLAVGAVVYGSFRLYRDKVWRKHFSRLYNKRISKISFYVICFYILIFLLSSIRYPVFIEVSGNKVYDKSISLLEAIYSPAREESYSSPFASHQLTEPEKKNNGVHVAGTNINGEDVLLRGLLSIRTAFIIGVGASILIIPIALLFGVMAGYFGGKIDMIVTYIYSTMASIPGILLLITLMRIFGRGLTQTVIALAIISWIGLCRLFRGETIKLKNSEFVQAAYTLGHSHSYIIWKHIIPNLSHIILISAVLGFSGLVMSETILSYLGLGVSTSSASWGMMIDQARMELARDPVIWWNIGTAFVLMFTLLLAVNFFGDVLRDILDPRVKGDS